MPEVSTYRRARRQPGTASSIGIVLLRRSTPPCRRSTAGGTDIDTAISTGGAPDAAETPSAHESLSGVYTRRSSVATDDMIRFSRADAFSHSAL